MRVHFLFYVCIYSFRADCLNLLAAAPRSPDLDSISPRLSEFYIILPKFYFINPAAARIFYFAFSPLD